MRELFGARHPLHHERYNPFRRKIGVKKNDNNIFGSAQLEMEDRCYGAPQGKRGSLDIEVEDSMRSSMIIVRTLFARQYRRLLVREHARKDTRSLIGDPVMGRVCALQRAEGVRRNRS